MLAVTIPKELEEILEDVARRTKRSTSYHAKKALLQYLEDQEDYLDAMDALKDDDGTRYSWEEVKAEAAHAHAEKTRVAG